MMNEIMLGLTVAISGYLGYMLLKPKPNAIVLERVGDNFVLSKAYHNDTYLQYRRQAFPIPSTYDYWVMLWRGFTLRPKWVRFFYIENTMLSRISEGTSRPSLNPEIISQFIRSQTLSQLMRGLTIPKMTLLIYLILGLVSGVLLGIVLTGWFS